MSRRLLQLTMILMGLLTVGLAGNSLLSGVANPIYGPTLIPEVPALDSNLRFMGGMGLGLGLILLWIVPTVEQQSALFRAIWICAFLGGLGRFLSLFVVGWPPAPMIVFTVIEVLAVPGFLYWQNQVAKSSLLDNS